MSRAAPIYRGCPLIGIKVTGIELLGYPGSKFPVYLNPYTRTDGLPKRGRQLTLK
jgi:hypothetical protein